MVPAGLHLGHLQDMKVKLYFKSRCLVAKIELCLVRRIRKIAKGDYQLRHARPSVRMVQLGSHWTNFR